MTSNMGKEPINPLAALTIAPFSRNKENDKK